MRYALKFAYDGTAFDGYARQPDHITIEGSMIKAMHKVGILNGEDDKIYPASRTDKGVSALGNVLVIDTEHAEKGIIPMLNSKLDGIIFYGIARVDDEFKPRYAYQRWYRYFMLNKGGYDPNMLLRISDVFLGEHEFKHFSKTWGPNPNQAGISTVKTAMMIISRIIVFGLKLALIVKFLIAPL